VSRIAQRPHPDFRDIAIEHGGDDHAELAESVARYRLCFIAALGALAERERQIGARDRAVEHLRAENRRLRAHHEQQLARARDEYRRLRDENRRLRAAIMLADAAKVAA
jgi:hypothetical protein